MPYIPISLFAHFAEDSGVDFMALDFLSKLDEIDKGIKKNMTLFLACQKKAPKRIQKLLKRRVLSQTLMGHPIRLAKA